jgi:hypothetical protein
LVHSVVANNRGFKWPGEQALLSQHALGFCPDHTIFLARFVQILARGMSNNRAVKKWYWYEQYARQGT